MKVRVANTKTPFRYLTQIIHRLLLLFGLGVKTRKLPQPVRFIGIGRVKSGKEMFFRFCRGHLNQRAVLTIWFGLLK